jgi:hypothetical protein
VEDQKVLNKWEDSVCQVDGRYQLPIPFREENPLLANNITAAKCWLASLQRKFERDRDLFENYKLGMEELLGSVMVNSQAQRAGHGTFPIKLYPTPIKTKSG